MYDSNEYHLCTSCQRSEHLSAMYMINDKLYCPNCVLDGRKEGGIITECRLKKDKITQRKCKHYEKATNLDRCMYLKSKWICDKLVKK